MDRDKVAATAPKTVLVADDEALLRQALVRSLKRAGHEVIEAKDGEEAIKKTWELAPDILLLDWVMPKRTGGEVLEVLRQDKRTKDLPIIVLTNVNDNEQVFEAVQYNADFLVKADWSLEQILEIIGKKLN